MADHLRTRVATLGYGVDPAERPQEALEHSNELDERVLDSLHVAGDRMRRLISMLEGV
jgi:hypothetical protein